MSRFYDRRAVETQTTGAVMHILLIFTFVTFALFGSMPANAQTPDGETPANEAICDSLIGLTPGLYGLCVAYCEAHDAHILSPGGDPAELDMPNRKILRNYNRKKTDSDPPMPCVQQGSCPCWTANQLSIVLPPSMNYDVNFTHSCSNNPGFLSLLENFENGSGSPGIQLVTFFNSFCSVVNNIYPGGPPTGGHNLTVEEYESCDAHLVAHANVYKVDGVVWDCFAAD